MSSFTAIVHSLTAILDNRQETVALAGEPASTILYRQFLIGQNGSHRVKLYTQKIPDQLDQPGKFAQKLALEVSRELHCEWCIACVSARDGGIHVVIQCHGVVQLSIALPTMDDKYFKTRKWWQSYWLLECFLDVLIKAQPPC